VPSSRDRKEITGLERGDRQEKKGDPKPPRSYRDRTGAQRACRNSDKKTAKPRSYTPEKEMGGENEKYHIGSGSKDVGQAQEGGGRSPYSISRLVGDKASTRRRFAVRGESEKAKTGEVRKTWKDQDMIRGAALDETPSNPAYAYVRLLPVRGNGTEKAIEDHFKRK